MKIGIDCHNLEGYRTGTARYLVNLLKYWAKKSIELNIEYYIAPILYRGKIALTLHDIIYEARPDLYDWPSVFDKILLKKVSKISAQKAKIIFTCSEFSKKEIVKYYKINPEKVFVVPLAADEKFKDVGRATSNIKKRFILYVGAIVKRRFVPETIKAFNKIIDSFVV